MELGLQAGPALNCPSCQPACQASEGAALLAQLCTEATAGLLAVKDGLSFSGRMYGPLTPPAAVSLINTGTANL